MSRIDDCTECGLRAGDYYKHFNYRLVNGEIAVQPRESVGLAMTDYADRLRAGERSVTFGNRCSLYFPFSPNFLTI